MSLQKYISTLFAFTAHEDIQACIISFCLKAKNLKVFSFSNVKFTREKKTVFKKRRLLLKSTS